MNKFLIFIVLVIGQVNSWAQNEISIGILDEIKTERSEALLVKLKQEINAVIGPESDVNFKEVLHNEHSVQTAGANYERLISEKTDIVISFGVVNTLMLYKRKEFPVPTIIVGAINNDLVNLPKDKRFSGINNLTYLVTPFSYREDLDAFTELYNFNNIGIVIDDYLLELLPLEELFDKYFKEKKSSYEIIPLEATGDFENLFENIDAVYLVSKTNLNDIQLEELISTINSKKIPSMSGYGVSDVEKGVLLTNQPAINYDQIMRRIALNVESLKNDVNASELPLHIDYNKELTLNMSVAEQIEFPVKNSMVAKLNLIEGAEVEKNELVYSLKNIMSGVVDRNLTLQAIRKNIDLSEQDVKASKSEYLPDVNANAVGTYIDPNIAEISNGQNPEFSTNGNLNLNQVLYSEQATANISVQKSLLDAQIEEYNSNELDALLDASVAYFNALVLKTNVSINNRNLQLTKLNLNIADENLELGASTKADVLRLRSQMAQNTQSLIEARNTLKQSYYQINQLLNNPIDNNIKIKDTIIDGLTMENEDYRYLVDLLDEPQQRKKIVGFLIEEAKRNAPEIKNIEYNSEATDRIYRLNGIGRIIPTLALQGQYNYLFSKSGAGTDPPAGFPAAPDSDYNVAISLSLPIFQQNIRNINRQSSKIQLDQLVVQKEDVELNIARSINDLVLDLNNQIANIEISAVNLEYSKESLELSQSEYRNGAIPVIQLIDAQNNFIQAEFTNTTAHYNYHIVSLQLQRAIGYFFEMKSPASNQEFMRRAQQYLLNSN